MQVCPRIYTHDGASEKGRRWRGRKGRRSKNNAGARGRKHVCKWLCVTASLCILINVRRRREGKRERWAEGRGQRATVGASDRARVWARERARAKG